MGEKTIEFTNIGPCRSKTESFSGKKFHCYEAETLENGQSIIWKLYSKSDIKTPSLQAIEQSRTRVNEFSPLIITFEKQNLSYLSIAISFENLTWALNNVAFVAYLGSLCKFPFTATQYAVLSSFANIGRSFVAASSGYIVHSFGWVNFIIITALLGIPSLILLFKIFPKRQRHERI